MQNQKQFCFWKLSGIRTRLESSGSKLLLHQSVLGFKTYPCKNTKIKLMHLVKCTFLHWQSWLFDDQLVTWKMKFQKIEAICQNKLRIWTVQMAKTTANNANNNVHYIPQGRMAKRSKAPDSRKLLARDFWYTNVCVVQIPLLSEVFKHCEVSHELKRMQNQKQFCFRKPSGIRTRLDSSRSKVLLHQRVLGFKTPVRTQKSNGCISWNALSCIDKIGCRWSIINFKNEIPKIWNDMSKQITYLNLSKWQNNSKQLKR